MTLDDLPAVFLLCYAYGHRWDHNGGLMLEGGYQEDEFTCQCGTKKTEVWHRRTKRTDGTPRYSHPKGYKLGYRVSREDAKMALREQGWEDFQLELENERRGSRMEQEAEVQALRPAHRVQHGHQGVAEPACGPDAVRGQQGQGPRAEGLDAHRGVR